MPRSSRSPLRLRTLLISDAQLGHRGSQADYLLDLLRSVGAETIYLVGDIVDLWSLKRGFCWPKAHGEVLRTLLERVRSGTRVIYLVRRRQCFTTSYHTRLPQHLRARAPVPTALTCRVRAQRAAGHRGIPASSRGRPFRRAGPRHGRAALRSGGPADAARPAARSVPRAAPWRFRSGAGADTVIAPSTQMKQALCRHGVRTPIEIIPTGMPASGFMPGDRARHCERRVAAAGLAESVCFVGYLDRATALLDCYRAADVFVFASPTETQGLVCSRIPSGAPSPGAAHWPTQSAGPPALTRRLVAVYERLRDEAGVDKASRAGHRRVADGAQSTAT